MAVRGDLLGEIIKKERPFFVRLGQQLPTKRSEIGKLCRFITRGHLQRNNNAFDGDNTPPHCGINRRAGGRMESDQCLYGVE